MTEGSKADAPWRIFPMSATDIDQVLALEQSSFSRSWSRDAFLSALSSPHCLGFTAKMTYGIESGAIIAYACIQLVHEDLNILKIAVAPTWRNRGVGTALLHAGMETAYRKGAKTAFLEVRPSNHKAISFYRERGFQRIGIRPHYYPETGEDAFVMAKPLKENNHEH